MFKDISIIFQYLQQYTVLEIQLRPVKHTVVTRTRKDFEQLLIHMQVIQRRLQCVDVNNPLQTVFKQVYTVYNYSNYMINQLL